MTKMFCFFCAFCEYFLAVIAVMWEKECIFVPEITIYQVLL